MRIKELIIYSNNILRNANVSDYIIKSRLLLSNLLDKNKEYLMVHDDENVSSIVEEKFFDWIKKLENGVPIQYIINKQEFMGLEFFVNESVLIPQPDTEILVQEIINNLEDKNKILDLCTGSGAIGISIAKLNKNKSPYVVLSDISISALKVAKINCEKNKVNAKIVESNLFENINEKFDIIVSNPPYIETNVINSLSMEVKNEPIIALDGGEDGLDFYRKISKQAKDYLNPNGILGLEIGYNQKEAVTEILSKDDYINIISKKDYAGNNRVIICKRSC